uniref:Uncharacterized protein n=1 Tax=Avena sativa TaxID=4498 RepID=A0ACD5UYT0_AVESA
MYLQKIDWSVYMNRYTNVFIGLISDVVKAILALHSAGYCCNSLSGRHIAVTEEHGSISAKIWFFQKCLSDKDKDKDWIVFGKLLETSQLMSLEKQDLCNKLTAGSLRGMDILAHSAVLTVRKKFQNVLALYLNQKTHWKSGSVGAPGWLNDKCLWNTNVPAWIWLQSISTPAYTRRGFCEKLRHLVEHEVDFLNPNIVKAPPIKDQEKGQLRIDLECSVRKVWEFFFLELQEYVRKSKLTY